jgi:hypothetical protein
MEHRASVWIIIVIPGRRYQRPLDLPQHPVNPFRECEWLCRDEVADAGSLGGAAESVDGVG